MVKKKQEMSQVYSQGNNEFIFGEKGGRGKNLLSFLKNLSLTGSSSSSSSLKAKAAADDIKEINSNIYGNLSYGFSSPEKKSTSPGATSTRPTSKRSLSGHALTRISSGKLPSDNSQSRLSSPYGYQPHQHRSFSGTSTASPRSQFRRPTYTDLDDDWDAGIDDVEEIHKTSTDSSRITAMGNNSGNDRDRPNPYGGMLDSLYPDLTIPVMSGSTAGAGGRRASLEQRSNRSGVSATRSLLDSQDLQARLEVQKLNQLHSKFLRFRKVLTEDDTGINLGDLRKLSWNGVPAELRAITWQLLLGYLPTNRTRQKSTLRRKRQEYLDGLKSVNSEALFDDEALKNASSSLLANSSNRDNTANKEKQLNHQIKIDIKRTSPTVKLYSYEATQKSFRRILYLWALRHPASGYVQGINDLVIPFYQIFLGNYLWQLQRKRAYEMAGGDDDSALFLPGLLDTDGSDTAEDDIYNDPELMSYTWENFDSNRLSDRVTSVIEADTYWCLSRLLDNITDNYIHEQPGIIRQVNDLRNLIAKIDLPLLQHLEHEGVEFIQFSFRWMNCLLMRELSTGLIIRMWDTYLSESPLGFNEFHVYVCAAFLIKFSGELKGRDFQEILLFLQNPPTKSWVEKDVELMLSEAYIWQSLYKNASAHLR